MNRERMSDGGDRGESRTEARVIPFRTRKLTGRHKPRVAPVDDPVTRLEKEEDRRRMQQNAAAALVLVLLLVAGAFLIDRLRTSSSLLACIEAGHRNCLPLDVPPR